MRYTLLKSKNKIEKISGPNDRGQKPEKQHQWNQDEIERFKKAIKEYGKNTQKIAEAVKTRSVIQVRARFFGLKQRL